MAKPPPEYELVLMLDPESPDERREQIASDARQRIESAGALKHDAGWGMRKMAYEIRQRTEADYRFFRFENGGSLLDDLNHNLRIADGVLRFRIFKVDPAAPSTEPPPPVSLAASAPPRGGRRGEGGRRGDGPPREAREEPAEEAAPEPADEAQKPAEEAPADAGADAPADSAADAGAEAAADGAEDPGAPEAEPATAAEPADAS